MRSRWSGWVLVAAGAMLAPAMAARAAGKPPIVVTLSEIVGLPPDLLSRREFLDAFHAEFDSGELRCERHEAERWSASGERRSRFQLVDMAAPGEAWTLSLSIGAPPDVRVLLKRRKPSAPAGHAGTTNVRASRGLNVLVSTLSPDAAGRGTEPTAVKFAVYFPDARRVLVPSNRLPGGGYAYPWADAGRVAARAALEALYRANDDMADDERADLAPAVRTEDAP